MVLVFLCQQRHLLSALLSKWLIQLYSIQINGKIFGIFQELLFKSVACNMVAKEFQRDLISSDVNLSLLRYFF